MKELKELKFNDLYNTHKSGINMTIRRGNPGPFYTMKWKVGDIISIKKHGNAKIVKIERQRFDTITAEKLSECHHSERVRMSYDPKAVCLRMMDNCYPDFKAYELVWLIYYEFLPKETLPKDSKKKSLRDNHAFLNSIANTINVQGLDAEYKKADFEIAALTAHVADFILSIQKTEEEKLQKNFDAKLKKQAEALDKLSVDYEQEQKCRKTLENDKTNLLFEKETLASENKTLKENIRELDANNQLLSGEISDLKKRLLDEDEKYKNTKDDSLREFITSLLTKLAFENIAKVQMLPVERLKNHTINLIADRIKSAEDYQIQTLRTAMQKIEDVFAEREKNEPQKVFKIDNLFDM